VPCVRRNDERPIEKGPFRFAATDTVQLPILFRVSGIPFEPRTVRELIREEIAKIKMPDLNCFSLDAAVRSVKGTARSMGVDVVA
jgi:hypothetical protein